MDSTPFTTEFLPRTLNPFSPYNKFSFFKPFNKSQTLIKFQPYKRFEVVSLAQNAKPESEFGIFSKNCDVFSRRDVGCYAGRSKKTGGASSSGGRLEGNADFRRRMKRNARVKSKKLAESLFYRLKNPRGRGNYPDNFSEDLLQQIGLGYDRMVRFMEKDDPNLRHPYDWYKYGEYGPYSWRGIVVGEPVSGGITDECVTIINEVKDHEEWEEIEKSEMAADFGKKVKQLDQTKLRYFWVFIRHPKWRVSELPWQQWTLVSEVVLEAGKQRLDKWTLMGRLGNKARSLVAQCAAWMRPDIVYVKRPVFQCRFEPQDNFFNAIIPFLDPRTEQDYLCQLENDDGSVETCTYYGGLCKLVKVNQKAFVDDVVNAYQKLSDEKKSKCLEFLLGHHPVQILHPYTKEWKAKLEEMELGCDAPDEEDDDIVGDNDTEIIDWIEDEGSDGDAEFDDGGEFDDDDDDQEMEEEDEEIDNFDINADQDLVTDMEESKDGKFHAMEEDVKGWKEFRKATNSAEAIENMARKSVKLSTELYKKQMMTADAGEETTRSVDGDETVLRGKRAKVSPEEWKYVGVGPWRKKIKKSKLPPDLFLRAAVRPFNYRNLVKEIVLTRHAILDGDIGRKE
ncbi:hypothetical protein MtrunA17_Chr5g0435731 [Medicago truncatula]|uniref:Uncharacterized protein n=1 Tax=Medicago truncatula TaxID=3880 RepID=G7KGV1_MEDTR|nr:uncharacterized protein LOC11442963 [Medicago truncatula]XP_024640347.1 uncharacterized protein LOC11442963 [Medicago truncatula]AES99428.1 hypothetical protein MTR_5g080700 [Medicago truncatula]RHN57012.1 hypothetical protein MtrunA17_Chr5g0435731 [Medicago truncatula]